MDVRFQCPACDQPIEVDGEWAGAAVACPYCQKTVTAPASSTFQPNVPPPTAQPLAGAPAAYPGVATPGVYSAIPPGGRNTVAVVALSLAVAALLSALVVKVVISSNEAEFREMGEIASDSTSFADSQAALMEWMQKQGGVPTWFVAISLFYFLGLGTWVASLVCSIVAVRRPVRRNLAWASFGVLFVSMVALCI
ncbi:MAG: hypothetical protein IID37_00140 [Planctomycetes bacterium]|nr:hypothetical protein [Planctomycetota bacterium]